MCIVTVNSVKLGGPKRCFGRGEKKELFAIPSFCTMQHYPSLFLRHSLASPLNHSHFLPYHCYHKSSGNAFSLVLVHSICFFSFQAPDTLKREGERCNNQRILYGTEEQPMNFFFLGKVQDIHYINFDSPTEFKRLTRSRLASSWRPGSENVHCCFFPP